MKDCIIAGAGIVGLATAYRLLKHYPDLKILIVEKEDRQAKHQTGNNSGVIHSGLYYKPGSLKATNCITGYRMLLDFCDEFSIPYDICGKVVVATKEVQKPLLEQLYLRGVDNGLDKTVRITLDELREIEPHCAGVAAIRVPYTGIVDYGLVAEKLAEQIRFMGGEIEFGSEVLALKPQPNGNTLVKTTSMEAESRLFINCAGLYCDKLAAMTHPDVPVRIIPFRGEYYMLKDERKHLVNHLIYPVPDPNFPFLGVHFTRMMKGGVEAGPNAVFAFKREGYKRTDVDFGELWQSLAWPGFRKVALKYWKTGLGEYYRSFSKQAFTKALQELVPEVKEDDLVPAGAGVRAQACDRTGGLVDDFMFLEAKGIIHVLNAPSPAATSSLSIGETIASMALKQLEHE